MIVKMKKVTLLCMEQDRKATLDALHGIGVLHLVPVQTPEGSDLDARREELKTASAALHVLEQYTTEASAEGTPSPADVVTQVHDLVLRKKLLQEEHNELAEQITRLQPFGHFDPQTIHDLADKGLVPSLFKTPKKGSVEIPEGYNSFTITEDSSTRYMLVVGQETPEIEGAEVFLPPSKPLAAIETECAGVEKELASIEATLANLSAAIPAITKHIASIEQSVTYLEAHEGMGADRQIAYLQGFCPVDKTGALQAESHKQGWAIIAEDPSKDERVPTLVRYPTLARIVQPVFKFLGIVPGYKETDISMPFLCFLSIFFAMIVGDAGYGILFLILLPYFRKKSFSKAPAEPFKLLYVFSASTVVWGVMTANYFGIDVDMLPALLQNLQVNALIGQNNSMTFSLLLGAIHLTLAHGWKALRYGRDPRAFTQVGWIFIVWCIFSLARMLLVKAALPVWFVPAIGGGALMVVVGLIIAKAWMDLGLLILDLISCFGDIMSYLRLFALGIASVKVAAAFNTMGGNLAAGLVGDSGGPIVIGIAFLAMTLVIVIGHALNIILCAMSVLVHGVRLNALEFSLHMGQEWSGFEYTPFTNSSSATTDLTT